jgi:hypothetical protein
MGTEDSDSEDERPYNRETLEQRAKSLFKRREKSQERHKECLVALGLWVDL